MRHEEEGGSDHSITVPERKEIIWGGGGGGGGMGHETPPPFHRSWRLSLANLTGGKCCQVRFNYPETRFFVCH